MIIRTVNKRLWLFERLISAYDHSVHNRLWLFEQLISAYDHSNDQQVRMIIRCVAKNWQTCPTEDGVSRQPNAPSINRYVMWYMQCGTYVLVKCKAVPRQAEVAQGVPGRLRPRIFLTFRHYKGGRSSAKRTGRLYPRRNPWHSLSVAESASGHMVL